jgi:hypothetical protein
MSSGLSFAKSREGLQALLDAGELFGRHAQAARGFEVRGDGVRRREHVARGEQHQRDVLRDRPAGGAVDRQDEVFRVLEHR